MGLFAELSRPLPRIPVPILPKVKCALEVEADRVRARFGGVPREPAPARDVLARVEAMLGADGAGVAELRRRELRIVPYIVWGRNVRWRADAGFMRLFLTRVNSTWPNAPRRLWLHYALNFDAFCPATVEVAAWLHSRLDSLPEPIRAFSREFSLFDTERAPKLLAQSVFAGDPVVQTLFGLGVAADLLRPSALMASVLEAAGALLASAADVKDPTGRLLALLGGTARNSIAEANCAPKLQSRALRSLVDGLVAWQVRREVRSASPEPTVDFLLALNGDPRFKPTRWRGHVDDASIAAVQRWLSHKTIESFFRVIDALQTDRPDMWKDRRSFWLNYLPHISNAWLVAGKRAAPLAEREGTGFGRFSSNSSVQPDHCGLLLQIGSACVLEMNKTGRATFWDYNDPEMPRLYEATYNRYRFSSRVDSGHATAISHNSYWQAKFRDEIFTRTGIDIRSFR
jgi:hypothetical protein